MGAEGAAGAPLPGPGGDLLGSLGLRELHAQCAGWRPPALAEESEYLAGLPPGVSADLRREVGGGRGGDLAPLAAQAGGGGGGDEADGTPPLRPFPPDVLRSAFQLQAGPLTGAPDSGVPAAAALRTQVEAERRERKERRRREKEAKRAQQRDAGAKPEPLST